jgi:hypothetical protein
MRSLVRSIGIAAGVLLLAGVQHATAQVITDTVEFTTTFPFTVGNTTVPAGTYSIRQDDDSPQVLELTGGRTSVLFETRSTQAPTAPSKTEVVFQRHGDAYLLKSVWLEGQMTGAEATAVEGERHMAKHRGAEGEQRIAGRKKAGTSNK